MTVPAVRPDATPAQRAWAAFEFIRLNPEQWDQSSFGRLAGDRVVGCFAHHVVRMAGYEQFGCKDDSPATDPCRHRVKVADLSEELATALREECGADKTVGTERIARELLGGAPGTIDLFRPSVTLDYLRLRIKLTFGPNPIQGAVDEVNRTAQHRAADELQDLTYAILDGGGQ